MGDAKRKRKAAANAVLSAEERAAMLGSDPFKAAYDLLYGMVESVYTQSGGVNHELIGLEFEAGKPAGVNVLLVKRTEDVPRLRDQMLLRWPMVAHICGAWSAPDTSMPPHTHPQRKDVVGITLHTVEFVAVAQCEVDAAARTVKRGDLLMPTETKGRLGRSVEQRPLSS